MGFNERNVRCKVLGGSVLSHSRREFYHEGVDSGYKFVSDSLQSLCRLCFALNKVDVRTGKSPRNAMEKILDSGAQ